MPRHKPNESLKKRYLTDGTQGTTDERAAAAPALGEPFKFGEALKFSRPVPDYLSGPQWHVLSYLDPASLWDPIYASSHASTQVQPRTARAKVVKYGRGDPWEEQHPPIPPPAQVTISKAGQQGVSGVRTRELAGVAVREYATINPSSGTWTGYPDSYTLHERLGTAEARKRDPDATAAALTRLRAHAHVGGPWEYDGGRRTAMADTVALRDQQATMTRSGPAFTMGQRTKALLPGQSLLPPQATEVLMVLLVPQPLERLAPHTQCEHGHMSVLRIYQDLGNMTHIATLTLVNMAVVLYLDIVAASMPYEYAEDLPGPGPATTLGSRPAPVVVDPTPGPGDYQGHEQPGRDMPAFTMYERIQPKQDKDAPAPGEYDIPCELGRSGAAWTMRGRAQEAKPIDFPGPGLYSPVNILGSEAEPPLSPGPGQNCPADIFDQEAEPPDSPGPGQYCPADILETEGGPAHTFGSRPGEKEESWSPGPADYYKPVSTSGPAYTINARNQPDDPRLKEAAALPGPGQYDYAERADAPAYTFGGKGTAEDARPDSPGPAAYDIVANESGPAFTIASKPLHIEPTGSPGPAEYDLDRGVGSGPAFTIAARHQGREPKADLPAPGEYMLPSDSWRCPGEYIVQPPRDGPAYTMGRRADPVSPTKNDSPGPTDYNTRPRPDGPAYSMFGKIVDKEAPPSPGPGAYHGELPRDGPAFTMRPKPPLPDDEGAMVGEPGPGAYTPRLPKEAPAFSLTSRPKESAPPDSPGPSSYQKTLQLDKGPAYTIGTKPAVAMGEKVPDSPGPTQYAPKSSSLGGPAFTMGGKPRPGNEKDEATSPGPGEYHSPNRDRGPAFTMLGKSQDFQRPHSPAPGDYHKAAAVSDGPAFSMAGKPHTSDLDPADDDSPGLGGYGIPVDPARDPIGRSGPSFTIRSRSAEAQHDTGPSPGDYPAPSSPSGPSYTMASKTVLHDLQPVEGPGPGQYGNPGPKTGETGPAFTLRPQYPLPKKSSEEGPAPGDYQQHSDLQGPAYSMRTRPSDPADATLPERLGQAVGPGQYHTEGGPNGPAYIMASRTGQSKRGRKKKSGLDPGQYHRPLEPTGPAPTFGDRPKQAAPQYITGPGDYDTSQMQHPDGPAFTLRPLTQPPRGDQVPGPGHYMTVPSILRTGPAHTMSFATAFVGEDGEIHGGPRPKRVSFTGDTLFRDSMDAGIAAVPRRSNQSGEDIGRLAAAARPKSDGRRPPIGARSTKNPPDSAPHRVRAEEVAAMRAAQLLSEPGLGGGGGGRAPSQAPRPPTARQPGGKERRKVENVNMPQGQAPSRGMDGAAHERLVNAYLGTEPVHRVTEAHQHGGRALVRNSAGASSRQVGAAGSGGGHYAVDKDGRGVMVTSTPSGGGGGGGSRAASVGQSAIAARVAEGPGLGRGGVGNAARPSGGITVQRFLHGIDPIL
eukprot:gene23247-30472_t